MMAALGFLIALLVVVTGALAWLYRDQLAILWRYLWGEMP
jgi:hypothetical protein